MILKHLKNQLLEGKFNNTMRGQMTAADFEWVITVPAMWRSRGKQMMREAAYKVSFIIKEIRFAQCHRFQVTTVTL